MKYSISFFLLSITAVMAFGQPGTMHMKSGMMPMKQGMMPMQSGMMPPPPHGPYKDSVAFQKAFAELYPLIRPTPNVRESAQMMLLHMGPMFRMRGIDSASAYDTAMKAIDPNMDKQILFDAYRSEFSAKEISELTSFFKTPVGRHYLEVELPITFARSNELRERIARTIFTALKPMIKASENERNSSEHKGQPESSPASQQ